MTATPGTGRRIIGVAAAKGGVGQSAVALAWARALGEQGHRCLLLEAAGGDLAWMFAATPSHFAEDVAQRRVSPEDAVVSVGPGTEFLGTGSEWSVFGAAHASEEGTLVEQLSSGPWTHWIIDLGSLSPRYHHALWDCCTDLALVLHDDLACVSRTYALARQLAARGWGDRIALIFNRLSDSAQAESLAKRFNQLTQQFLGATWPLIGVVPDADQSGRFAAIRRWASGSDLSESPDAVVSQEIIKPAEVADN